MYGSKATVCRPLQWKLSWSAECIYFQCRYIGRLFNVLLESCFELELSVEYNSCLLSHRIAILPSFCEAAYTTWEALNVGLEQWQTPKVREQA